MFVVAVANQKGGVAKTTTCLSLAAGLAQTGRRVLAVDLDPQANLGIGAGLDHDGVAPALYEVLTQGVRLEAAAQRPTQKGLETLSIVHAGARLAQAEGELLGRPGFDELLKSSLRTSAGSWDLAVLDCPPSLGPLTINALGSADLVVVPVQCEFFSARGVVKLLEVVELVRERRNRDLQVRLVPTLYDQRNAIQKAVLAQLRAELGADVSDTVIGIDTKIREAQAKGIPIGLYAPKARAAEAYAELSREVLTLAWSRAQREAARGEAA